ncbi:MAG TPA: hypothetical protein VGO96_18320 [Pyrinomonadaceae bacterium]|jgi:hypothetical protein|nr:hypothetical protein [Pyrinomonadaceae bacterium]
MIFLIPGVLTLVILPFLFFQDDRVRKRLFIPFSAAPAVATLLMYHSGYNAYAFILIGLVFILPLSLLLTIIGLVLIARARSREQAWSGLTAGTLLASVPLLLAILGVILWASSPHA